MGSPEMLRVTIAAVHGCIAISAPGASRVRSASRTVSARSSARSGLVAGMRGPVPAGPAPGLKVKARSSRVIGARHTATWARTAAWRGVSKASSSVSRMSALPRIIAWSIAWLTGRSWRRSMSWLRARSRSLAWTWRRLARPPRSSASVNSISRGWPPMVRISSRWSAGSSSARAGSRRNIRRSSAADSAGTGTSARNRSGPGSGYRQVTSSAPAWAASARVVMTC